MEILEKVFEIIYNSMIQQNKRMLYEISVREKISYHALCQKYIPTRKKFKEFLQSSSSSPSSS